ncbi:hypothetical protein FDK12_00135 [Arthrobacter sp. NamB2]|uniref:hypothetical protein n=1 Tax=Arthrobacter sp. NamB2 TaxID=2576035 RepID=UPI0010C994A0|nr:hypothetical protein [Arthrobacter sp. NamB2]TKV29398.1 hypothetical protein FDK12_00135 [Arthrobacter sp. NamB2]
MPDPRHRRYQVRLRTAVAGSFLAAAAAASLTGATAAPALAVPPRAVAADVDHEAGDITLGPDPASSVTVASPVAVASGTTSAQVRLAGVRDDLDQAVLMRLVTPEQADGFYAQIERRIAAGL